MVMPNLNIVDFAELHEKAVRSSVTHLFEKIGLAWFGCERFFDNGDALFLTTDASIYRHHLSRGIDLRQCPKERQIQNNVFEDILIPQVNTTRRHTEEVKAYGHGCQAIFIVYSEGYHDVFRFALWQEASLAINALITNWNILERTIHDFWQEHGETLASSDRVLKLPGKGPDNYYRPMGRLTLDYKKNKHIELPVSEMRILPYYADDKPHKVIATALDIAVSTPETYLERIRLKAGLNSRKELKSIARANRLTLGFHKSCCRNS